jgi:DMSO/TMAO reductase YedYZ molybdopterin-dependent catalytic subunit
MSGMMKQMVFILSLISVVDCSQTRAQSEGYVTIEGRVKKNLKLSIRDLEKFTATEIKSKDKEEKEHLYKGVALADVLASAGVTLGKDLRGENLAQYVVVKAADGYEVVFSLSEVDPELTDNTILLAYQMDGRPLAAQEGPFRLVVPKDKKHARWIRQLTVVKVMSAKD